MLTFNTIDLETANADRATICQIGIVHVRNGEIADEWETLVNPEEWFDPYNTSLHGIDEFKVEHSPRFPDVYDELHKRLVGSILVSHTSFDQVALIRSMTKYDLEQFEVKWLDSAMIARRVWPEKYGRSGYGLRNIVKNLSISFKHHDALGDATASAKIVLRACDSEGIDIDGWLNRVKQPVSATHPKRGRKVPKRERNVEGALSGETILFTGALEIPRWQAEEEAAKAGCDVVRNASKKVTIFVVGIQNYSRLKGYEKSSKHRKIEALISKGSDIQILSGIDFLQLIDADMQLHSS